MDSPAIRYLSGYSQDLQDKAQRLLAENQLGEILQRRYPDAHGLTSANALYDYTITLKNKYLRSSPPVNKVIYDDKIHVVHNALGLHTAISRPHGGKLRAKKEIRISAMFRATPEPFLRMIVVHELAHLREKDHNKAFYNLCQHMTPDYHQLELDVRLYLSHRDLYGDLW
ncbi:MAG: M48 family metallopeptidase [Alcanivoracaceae bacterium]|nr:M48 family metallopeptidase [Alcanivoracaceae bacterium]